MAALASFSTAATIMPKQGRIATPAAPIRPYYHVQRAQGACLARRAFPLVRSSPAQSNTITAEVEVSPLSSVSEITVESWDEIMEEAGDVPVIVDFFADWCGPCKMISPEYENLASEYPNAKFMKINCGTNDRKFFSNLGIRALPTFQVYKRQAKVAEYIGSRKNDLRKMVEQHA